MKDDIFVNSPVIVLEMQNDINKLSALDLSEIALKRINDIIFMTGATIIDILIKVSIE